MMLDFADIKIIQIKEEKLDDGKLGGWFEIRPLPRGYGHTVGNSLRRTLYSSIPGYAIVSIRINEKPHEFSTISGVLENVLDIVLNLKKVRFKVKGNLDQYTVQLAVKGKEGEVTAGEFETPAEVEIVNKDHKIATLTDKKASLTIEAVIKKGVGYKEADESAREEIGTIPMDAIFSPVLVVDYKVVPVAKQGKVTFEKVELYVETDGSVTPKEALVEAVSTLKNLVDHMAEILGVVEQEQKSVEEGKEDSAADKSEGTPIDTLDLPASVISALKAEGITTVETLKSVSEKDLLKIKGIGKQTVQKILDAIK